MKNIILLMAILIVIFVQHHVFCNESILSKFHQHTYKLKDNRMELMRYNKNYFNFFEIKTFKYNRTIAAHNLTINMKVDARDKLEGIEQLYKFLSNEYRRMAVRFQINLQKSFESNAAGLHSISKCGNTTSFSFYKDITYHICNFVFNHTELPPLIPDGRYKLELTFLLDNKEIALINNYAEFHQHAYKLKDVRVDLVSYDKDYFNFFEIKTFKWNRTTVAHNVTLNLKLNARDKTESVIQYYKFLSNEYRPLAVRFQINLQKGFKSNAMGVKAIYKCGNTTSFYFYKDITYHICNFVVDETQFPPLIPSGRYKLEETLLFDNKEVAVLNGYGEVYTPMAYPKN